MASDKDSNATPAGPLDLNARRRAALAEVDNAKFGWVHVKTCLVAGVGFYVSPNRCLHSSANDVLIAPAIARRTRTTSSPSISLQS